MIYIAFYLIFCAIVIRLSERPLDKELARTQGVDDALTVRKKIYARRKKITIASIVLFIVILFWVNAMNLFSVLIGVFYFSFFHPYSNLRGSISVYDKSSFFLNHPDYVFYLRGFYTDQYTNVYSGFLSTIPIFEWIIKRFSRGNEYFCEDSFIGRLILRRMPSPCAIGNPKEKDSPKGAFRLYLDENNWEKDVMDIMDEAKLIIILINDSPSCLLEIKHSIGLREKTVFLVPDLKLYERVQARLDALPCLPDYLDGPCYFYMDGSSPVFKRFYNDRMGCLDLGDEVAALYHSGAFIRQSLEAVEEIKQSNN